MIDAVVTGNPAEGERNAVRGYSAQYRIAAGFIFASLLAGELDWIRVADPEAGRVDDILIGRIGRVDAYQIKWSEYETRVTFRTLISPGGSPSNPQPSLLAQLSDGWSKLSASYPDRAVNVHLVMRSSPSDADDVEGTGRHLQAFLRHGWAARTTWTKDADAGVARDWSAAIESIRSATGMDADTFAGFAPSAHLHLGHRLADVDPSDRASRRQHADLEQLAAFLFRLVADERRIVELSRTELVRRLGWARRLDLRFRHDFPVDERHYQPISRTVSEIETALATFHRGYLALVGTPGSGKSTTLTQMLRYSRSHRVIRYYAFVRGDTAQGRGEAETFLSDVTIAIRRAGVDVRGPTLALPETLAELRELLGRQFGSLHEEWLAGGARTVILIDGLDHIAREQTPAQSLLDVLPSPDELPEGVLIILGSQSVGLRGLSARIASHLEEPGRLLTMHRLERRDVYELTASSLPGEVMSDIERDLVWSMSAGHPLALAYLLTRLALAPDAEARRSILDGITPFEGEIDETYRTHWQTLRDDAELRDLLGLLCRLRGSIDLDLIESLTSDAVLGRFVSTAAQFFHHETADRWTFFHNSFRQFLLASTVRNALGRDDPAREKRFHRSLADACVERTGTPLAWERLYHLEGAGDRTAILALFTQGYFRDQFMALRPLFEIRDDVAICLRAALAEDDRIAFIKALLIEQELGERDQAMEDADLPSLMLQLASPGDRADAAAREGDLLIPTVTALAYAAEILNTDPALARRLFDLAEPVAWVKGLVPVEAQDRNRLEAWAGVAWRFHTGDAFVRLCREIRSLPEEDPFATSSDGNALKGVLDDGFRATLLGIAAMEALRAGARDVTALFEAELAAIGGRRADAALWRLDRARVELTVSGDLPRPEGVLALERLCDRSPPDPQQPGRSVILALMLLRLGASRERIEAYMAASPAVLVGGVEIGRDADALDDYSPLFSQARVLSALGRPLDPIVAVPDDPKPHHHGAVLLQRMLVLIGNVRGQADAGDRLSPETVVRRLTPALNLFDRSWEDTRGWTDWHSVRGQAESYLEVLLRTGDAHGRESLHGVLACMTRKFAPDAPHRWPTQWRRAVLLSAHALDGDGGRTTSGLASLSGEIDAWTGVHERVADRAAQIRAWLGLGQPERARGEFAAMLATSFGVHHRDDDQYERWCGWAARMTDVWPLSRASAGMLPLLRGLAVMHGDRRGHDPDQAVSILFEAAAAVDPGWARDLHRWLLANRAGTRHAALTGLLRGVLRQDISQRTAENAVLTAARLVVPFEVTVDEDLAFALGKAVQSLHSGPQPSGAAATLLGTIATETYPENRVVWMTGLAKGVVAAGGDPAFLGSSAMLPDRPGKSEAEPKPSGLTMAETGFIGLAEIIKLRRDPAAFAAIVRRATAAQNLPWEDVLEAVLEAAEGAAVANVFEAVEHLRPPLRMQGWFAARFAVVGRPSDARAALNRAWAISSPNGWTKYYDGGTRLTAADLEISFYGEQGRRRVFETIVHDYLGEARHAGSLLRNLDRLIALIFVAPPLEAIWKEVSEHAGQLAEVAMPLASEPPLPTISFDDATSALVDLAFDDLGHPVPELADRARKLLLELLREFGNRTAMSDRVRTRLAGADDAVHESTLAFLCCAIEVSRDWTAEFAKQARDLASATASAVTTFHVGALLKGLGQSIALRRRRPLPPIYALHLPPAQMPSVGSTGKVRPGEPLEDTDDPVDLTNFLDVPLARIVDASGLSARNLVSRVAALMPEVAPRALWDRAAESRLKGDLESNGLKITYRRPRTIVARLAFGRVVQELVDAGVVRWPVPGLGSWLFVLDPFVSLIDASTRPTWLEPPIVEAMNKWSDKGWAGRPEDFLAEAPLLLPDGGLVLAEQTVWIKTDHGRPTEMRATQLAPHGYPWNGREGPTSGFFLHFPSGAFGAQYPMMWPPDSSAPRFPVFEGGGFLRPDFLAFSPALAFEQGWIPAKRGLFAWEDEDGALMVESLRWRDGNLLNHDRLGRDEVCGEGWAVVASASGVAVLKPILGGWRRYLTASRSVTTGDEWPRPTVARREQALRPGSALDSISFD